MIKLLIFTILLINITNVFSTTELTEPTNNNGPVSNIMENLSEHTSSVTNELLAQLATKFENTVKTLVGNMEVVVTSAVNQLAQPIEDFQSKIKSSQCQPLVSLQELRQRIDKDLTKCTQTLEDILVAFENDANDFNAALEQNIKNIIDLPEQCQGAGGNDAGFGSNVSCYVEKITEINKQIAVTLNRASMTLIHTRQLTDKALGEGRTCANNVVASTVQTLEEMLASCQLIKN
ncbi:uncharacterized protein ACRADG_012447 [Cochliomyia hominivorax]